MLYTWEQQCHLMSRVPYGIANRYIYIYIYIYTGCRIGLRDIGSYMQKQRVSIIGSPNNFVAKWLRWGLERIKLLSNFSFSFVLTSCGTERKARGELTQK
jgi:hypothetical protein